MEHLSQETRRIQKSSAYDASSMELSMGLEMMNAWNCQCKTLIVWFPQSQRPSRCLACNKCGTNLYGESPAAHEMFEGVVVGNDSTPIVDLTHCVRCLQSIAELEL